MFTIKQAAQRTGVPEASLRAWERRYRVVVPRRTESGYRLYDDDALAALAAMRRLVDDGWSPAVAAERIIRARQPPAPVATAGPVAPDADLAVVEADELTEAFLEAASAVDAGGVERVLERAFGLGSFEAVVDGWLMPTLRRLGEAWADGRVDVAGEHAAAHAVMRRLSQSFAAAGSIARGPRVVVALPAGSLHELGALAFATVVRRRGTAVVYLGADLPVESWVRAVHAFPTAAAVLAVPTLEDRAPAVRTVQALRTVRPELLVAAGGSFSPDLAPGVVTLPQSLTEAAAALEALRR